MFVTVDAPQLGRRERDMRFKAPQKSAVQEGDTQVDTSRGTSNALSSFIDPSLSWSDIDWIAGAYKRGRMPCSRPNAEQRPLWCRTTGGGSSTMREAVSKCLSK